MSRSVTKPLPSPLSHAIALALLLAAQTAAAAEADPGKDEAKELSVVAVTASPLRATAEDMARPVEVLADDALDRAKTNSLGETLSALPGVQSAGFGPGVGRPIIRGLEGARVQVLSGGVGTLDASTISADHAPAVEPFLADQIEVLKGPATLLFGTGAIGGAVNVADGRIARELPDAPISGRAEVRGNTVNDEFAGLVRFDGVAGNLVLHADGLVRNGNDYDIPGFAHLDAHEEHDHDHEHEGEEEEEEAFGTLPNSSVKTRSGALGATWFGEGGWLGFSASTYRTNYGIPEGAHVHAHEDDHDHNHDHDEDEDHDHDHAEEGHEEGPVRIDLIQSRFDFKGGLYQPFAFLDRIDLHLAHTDYEHTEFEGDEIGTVFRNRGVEGRIEAVHSERGGWNGAFGVQFGDTRFSADGEEAFVPPTDTRALGVFALQEKRFGAVKLELGGRADRVELEPEGAAGRSFSLFNVSAGAIWKAGNALELRAGLDRSERAPAQEELFANGLHVATQSIELGDAELDTERGLRAEVGFHLHQGNFQLKAAAYRTNFDNFIYLADTGLESDGSAVRVWTQQEAAFTGAEVEALSTLFDSAAGRLDARLFGDVVRAKLDGSGSRVLHIDVPHGDHHHHETVELANTGNLPRIAPARIGAGLAFERSGWRLSANAVRNFKQDDVAQNEAPSPAYTLVDAHLAYRWETPSASWEAFLDGANLTDEEARPHTSLLRDYAPLPGRSVAFGLRVWF